MKTRCSSTPDNQYRARRNEMRELARADSNAAINQGRSVETRDGRWDEEEVGVGVDVGSVSGFGAQGAWSPMGGKREGVRDDR